jgi:hypothetical protein
MTRLGFTLAGSGHPIVPVMLGDAALAERMAARLLERGIYVIGFAFPVVPKGQARIRAQDVGGAYGRRYRPGGGGVRSGRQGARGDRVSMHNACTKRMPNVCIAVDERLTRRCATAAGSMHPAGG